MTGEQFADHRVGGFHRQIGHIERSSRRQRLDGGGIFVSRRLRGQVNRLVGFEYVQPHDALLRIEQSQSDEIEGNKSLEAPAQFSDQRGKLTMGRDGFRYFEQRFIAGAGPIRAFREKRGHDRAVPAYFQP